MALSACEELENFELPFGGDDAGPSQAAAPTVTSGETETRDVEAPEVFQKKEAGLWDGRPSLGGVWVAHPDVTDPERVIIRNEDNGRFVVGALFRRERDNPGPALQVSSDAAEELGMLAGAPSQLNVVALRREEAVVAPPATTDFDAPTDVAIADLDAPAGVDVPAAPIDDGTASGVAASAVAALAGTAAVATDAAPVPSIDVAPVARPEPVAAPAPIPAEPVSNGAAAAIAALAGAAEVAAAEAALVAAPIEPVVEPAIEPTIAEAPAPVAVPTAPVPPVGATAAIASLASTVVQAPLDARGPIEAPAAGPIDVSGVITGPIEAAPLEATPLEPAPIAPEPVAAPEPAPEPEPTPTPTSSSLEKPFIQVGIFSLESNADGAAARLRSNGMAASVREQNSDGTKFWRVLVGPAPNATDRTAILAKVQGLGYSDAYYVSN